MSKFALRALANSITPELRQRGVKVTLISPGFVASNIRRVDNRGRFHPRAKDPVPAWLVMDTEKAVAPDVARRGARPARGDHHRARQDSGRAGAIRAVDGPRCRQSASPPKPIRRFVARSFAARLCAEIRGSLPVVKPAQAGAELDRIDAGILGV